MSDQVTLEVNTAADLARLRNKGRILSSQELKELSAKVKALEEIARLEDRLKALETRKHPRPVEIEDDQPERYKPKRSTNPSSLSYYLIVRPLIELGDSKSSLNTV